MNPRHRYLLGLTVAAAVTLLALEASARPGGGGGYSGGSSGGGYSGGGSSGGGDGAGMILYWLIRLVFAYPVVGVPLLIGFVLFLFWRNHNETTLQHDSFLGGEAHPGPVPQQKRAASLRKLRDRDPLFSAVLFEDFVYALYAQVHGARGDARKLATLAPYINEAARATLLKRGPAGVPIDGVVIGAMRVCNVQLGKEPGAKNVVELEFEANFTAHLPDGPVGHYVRERWQLERDAQVQTRAAESVQEFRCPNCGAAFTSSGDDRCSFCHQQVGEGRFDWSVKHVRLMEQEQRPPALTADHAEKGTDSPTISDPNIQAQHAALIAEDPSAAPERIEQRLRAIYRELNAAWSARDLRPARPFVSDALFNYLGYWITAYKQQGLRNVLEQMEISRVAIVKLRRDRHYDAITVRLWASGLDYTVRDADGKRVSGSARSKRAYSEYWTLIRGAAVRGAPKASDANCPGCGAPLDKVSMAGNCEYCGAHLTRGEFDWVLSKIEQDDSYTG